MICVIHRALTEGTYDERRYIVTGERPGEFKKHDYPPTIVYEEDRRAYYDALQAYDEQEDLIPLVQFLEAQTVKTWSRSTDGKKSISHKKLNSFLL